MSTAVSQHYQQQYIAPIPDFLNQEEIALLKRTILKQFSEDEQESFVRHCQRTRLDPFTRQIYATRRFQKGRDENGDFRKVPILVPVVGIHALTAVAERTGNYDGCEIMWKAKEDDWLAEWSSNEEMPMLARCIVYHKRHTHPEVGIARWDSFVGTQWNNEDKKWEVTEFWSRMGDYMLAKCAKAQALRGAFPDQLSGIYTSAELHGNVTEAETDSETISTDEQKILENRRKEAEAIKQFPHIVSTPTVNLPTPAEMAEPIEAHKIPAKPRVVETAAPTPAPPPVAPPKPEEPEPEPEPETEPAELSSPMSEVKEAPQPWRDHIILSVGNQRYNKRKIGELSQRELDVIEHQWLPKIRAGWDVATDEQRADAEGFERAIAFYKMEGALK